MLQEAGQDSCSKAVKLYNKTIGKGRNKNFFFFLTSLIFVLQYWSSLKEGNLETTWISQ